MAKPTKSRGELRFGTLLLAEDLLADILLIIAVLVIAKALLF